MEGMNNETGRNKWNGKEWRMKQQFRMETIEQMIYRKKGEGKVGNDWRFQQRYLAYHDVIFMNRIIKWGTNNYNDLNDSMEEGNI